MNSKNAAFTVFLAFLLAISAEAAEKKDTFFSPYVDSSGAISMPAGLRSTGVHLGTWIVTAPLPPGSGFELTSPGIGIHTTYTQRDSYQAFRKTGAWPDGTVIVLEVRAIAWDDLPTGHVMVEGAVAKWLVMIKDGKGRFPKNPNWGDGWGWALFTPSSKGNRSADYKTGCLGCHETAKATDRVFVEGYPDLR